MTPAWVHVASTIGFTVLTVCVVVLLGALTPIYAHMLTPKEDA
jgi:hypothetical protein